MKIEISIEKDGEGKPEGELGNGMSKQVSAFQRKVAKMLAQLDGRSKVTPMDMELASEIEEKKMKGGD